MISIAQLEKDPFRLFFPLGAVLGLAGVIPWIHPGEYPRDLHRVLMINGFLLSFVAGFLMTAIPRFTSAKFAHRLEIALVFLFIVGASMCVRFGAPALGYLFSGMAIVCLIGFAVQRFLAKKSNPPHTFIFIGVGLVLWLASNVGQFLVSYGMAFSPWTVVFQDLFSNGAIMSIVLGVGGRLIPGILGWEDIVAIQRKEYEAPVGFFSRVALGIWISIALFLGSFFAEPFVPLQICFATRGLVAAYFGFRFWRIHRVPKTKSFLTMSLWPCCWCLSFGYFLPAIWVEASVHALHLLFIGGISLITLLVSSRVIFAHSGAGTSVEKTSRSIAVFTGLILIAMVTRVAAILYPPGYLSHLRYAALVWILALLIWIFLVGKKIIPISGESK